MHSMNRASFAVEYHRILVLIQSTLTKVPQCLLQQKYSVVFQCSEVAVVMDQIL